MGNSITWPCMIPRELEDEDARTAQALSALNQCLLVRSPFFPAGHGKGPYMIGEGMPYLAIGDYTDAQNLPKLRAQGIRAVLNLSDMDLVGEAYRTAGIAYRKMHCLDYPSFPVI